MTQNAIIYNNAMPCSIGVLTVSSPTGEKQLFVPLQECSLSGTTYESYASCILTHTFSFSSESFDETIEAVFRFPLPSFSILTGCTVQWPDEMMVADCLDRDDAADMYHGAFLKARRGLFLFEESHSICTLHVTGISPDSPVHVRLSFAFQGDLNSLNKSLDSIFALHSEPRLCKSDEMDARYLEVPISDKQSSYHSAYVCTGKLHRKPVKATIIVPSGSFIDNIACIRTATGVKQLTMHSSSLFEWINSTKSESGDFVMATG